MITIVEKTSQGPCRSLRTSSEQVPARTCAESRRENGDPSDSARMLIYVGAVPDGGAGQWWREVPSRTLNTGGQDNGTVLPVERTPLKIGLGERHYLGWTRMDVSPAGEVKGIYDQGIWPKHEVDPRWIRDGATKIS